MTHLDILKFLAKKQGIFMYEGAQGDEEGDWEIKEDEADIYVALLQEIRKLEIIRNPYQSGKNDRIASLTNAKIIDEDADEDEEEPDTLELSERIQKRVDEAVAEAISRLPQTPAYTPGGERKPPWKAGEKECTS